MSLRLAFSHFLFVFFSFFLVVLLLLQPANASSRFDASQCGSSKQCEFGGCPPQSAGGGGGIPDPEKCAYILAIQPEGTDSVQMEVYTRRNSPEVKYIAVGFSEDDKMGDDSVTYCVLREDGRLEAHLAVNTPASKTNQAAPLGAENGMLELLEGAADDGTIYCKIRQHSNKAPQRDLARPNLQRPYILFLAKGTATEPRVIGIHELDPDNPNTFPYTSPTKMVPMNASFAKAGGSGGLNLIDFHGILMIIAWLAMSPIALYSARYMRTAWPHTTVMGLKIWFHIHRTLNFVSIIAMLVSLFLVLFYKGRWTGPWFGMTSIGWGAWHSLAGAVSVFLALTQPFGALLRCGIDHPKRPIFNWIHRSVGLSAFVLALFALFIAIWKFSRHFALPDFALWLLILFYATAFLEILVAEVLRLKELREHRKLEGIELQTRHRGSTPSDAYYYHTQKNIGSKLSSVRKLLFLVTVSLCAGVSTILVLLILFQS